VPSERTKADLVDPRSIAVLPFTDLSREGDQGYFADGIAEELLNLLARYKGLRVISRSSSFALRNSGLSIPELARKLNVAHVLEGSVRKAGDRIRITAQLIEASSDSHLWSDTYDRELDDVFAIQDQISAQVVQELKVRLLGAPPSADATNSAAYELYLQGLSLLARRDDLGRAVQFFEQVSAIDPDYAPAHASLALALAWMIQPGIEAAANRALLLDPGNSDALTALGSLRSGQSRTQEARNAFEQAIAHGPNNALAYRWLAMTYADPARCLALLQKAYLVDPLEPTIHYLLSTALSDMGRFDEALDMARSRLAADPGDSTAYSAAGSIYQHAGRLDLALKSAYLSYRAEPTRAKYNERVVWTLIDLDELGLAEAWQREIEQRTGFINSNAASVLANLNGRPEQALTLLVTALQRGEIVDQELAWWTIRIGRDYGRARPLYEQGFAKFGQDYPRLDPDQYWPWYIDYALILQRTGEPQRAMELIRDARALIDKQLADRVVSSAGHYLRFLMAQLYAMSGDTRAAAAALRQAVKDGFTCPGCLRDFPHFDDLRDDPAFTALIAELNAKVAAQRQRLADEGMLLTPGELMQLEDFSFDPFAADL
jgi:TolB-like protein